MDCRGYHLYQELDLEDAETGPWGQRCGSSLRRHVLFVDRTSGKIHGDESA